MGIYLGKASLTYLKTKISKMILARELKWAEITGKPSTYTPTTHTHAVATTTADGFMSKADKTKVNGIADRANNYVHPTNTSRALGLYKVTVDGLGHVSAVVSVTKADITALGIPGSDTNTTYAAFKAASASAAGGLGLVPAPGAGKQAQYLRGDGIWGTPTNTVYTHPAYTARTSGLYKVTVDGLGHVSAVVAVTKSDITALGIPGSDTNTVYTHPSTHPSSMITSTVNNTAIPLSEILACAVFPIAQDSSSVTFGNITEWLAAGKPKL